LHGEDDIKILFENRYGRCMLNVRFNPNFPDWLFNKSYISLVKLLASDQEAEFVGGYIDKVFCS